MDIETARKVSETDADKVFAILAKNDALEITIKGAIFIESRLIEFIEDRLVSPAHLKPMDLSFEDRVYLAIALGLRPSLQSPLKTMASIRNKFAHRTDADITQSDLDNLHNSMSAEDKKVVESTYQRTRKKTGAKRPARFKSQPLLDQYVHYILTLRGAIIVEHSTKGKPLVGLLADSAPPSCT